MNRRTAISTLALAAAPAIAGPVGLRLPGGFDPRQIAGLKLWLDASKITGLNDGDSVGTWNDLSGNANDATQATSNKKPTFQTNEINGLPAVQFDGVDDTMAIPSITITGYTAFVVGIKDSSSTSKMPLFCSNPGSSGGGFIFLYYSDANLYSTTFGGGGAPNGTFVYSSGAGINTALSSAFIGVADYESGAAANTIKHYINSTLYSLAYTHSAQTFGTGIEEIGARTNSGDYANAKYSEVLLYNSKLSDANRSLVESYLRTKWGTP